MLKANGLKVRVANRNWAHVQKTLEQLGNAAIHEAVKGVGSIEDPTLNWEIQIYIS